MFKTFAQLKDLLYGFRRTFYVYLLIVFFYEGAQVLNSYLLTGAIRLYEHQVGVWVWIVFFVSIEIFDNIFRLTDHALDWHVTSKLIYPIIKHVKMLVVRIFLVQDSAWHQQNNSGILVSKAENSTNKVADITDTLAWEFIPTLTQSVLTLPPLLYFSPLVAVIVLIALGLFLLITQKGEQCRLPLRKSRHDLYEELWQSTEEAVKAHETLAIYGQTERMIHEHEVINDRIIALGLQESHKTIYTYHAFRNFVIQNTSRLILGILMWQVSHKSITVPEVFFVYTLSERLLGAFWRFARLMQRMGESSEGIARLHKLSKEKPAIVDGPETRHNIGIPEKLDVQFDTVTFCYPGNEKEAVRDLSLFINDGEEVAIVGPSGSGKTTLRRLLLRLFEVTDGDIFIGGISIKHWPLEKLRSLFAYVPQGDEVFIFDNDIEYNIRFSRPDATFNDVVEATRQAGLQDLIASLPDGYKTKVGEKGMKLSGGQKQRVALARAIVSKRRFLILDEATSSVDALTEQDIEHGLREVVSKLTSIVIAHRMSTIWHADKIVVMNAGSKECEGTHQDLMVDTEGIYRRMVDLQTHHQIQ